MRPTVESESSVHVHPGRRCSLHQLQFLKYIQYLAGKGLVLLITLYKAAELTRNGKLTAQFGSTRKESLLNISTSEPKDAGTYFCAGSTMLPSLYPNLRLGLQSLLPPAPAPLGIKCDYAHNPCPLSFHYYSIQCFIF